MPADTSPSMRTLERHLAFEWARALIQNYCLTVMLQGESDIYHALQTAYSPRVADGVAYLEHRGLLKRHASEEGWVAICDEGEPIGEVA